MSQRRHALLAVGAWAILSIIGVVAVLTLGSQIMPDIASEEASVENRTFVLLTAVSMPVLAFVLVGMGYTAISFRARGEDGDGPPIHGHSGIQIGWVVLTTLMVLGLFVYGAIGLVEIRGAQEGDFEVHVLGKQWQWGFEYPEAQVISDELHIPVDRRVHLVITSNDAIHSLWLPALGVKQDAVPGHPTEAYLTATQTGTYSASCAELCGYGHTIMTTSVVVSADGELEAWLSEQEPMPPPEDGEHPEEPPPSEEEPTS